LHRWKSFTAKATNRILRLSGQFWQEDYFDRFIRDEEHYRAVVDYIEMNPVRAGLCASLEQLRFGSAWRRKKRFFEDSDRDASAPTGLVNVFHLLLHVIHQQVLT
jgi:hypothetical protein